VLVPGEMVKWTVQREVFAQETAPLRLTAAGEPFCA